MGAQAAAQRAFDEAVKFTKDFIGRKALEAVKREGVARRLASFTVEGFAPLLGGEPILLEGKVVGSTTSCGFGHSLGKTIAFGYLPSTLSQETRFEIEAYGRSWQATRGPRCLYDRAMERLKA